MESTLYQTITQAIKNSIDQGELCPGSKIPSVNELRKQYGVSHITVVRVYKELMKLHYIQSKRGCGYFVAPRPVTGIKSFSGKIGNFLRPLRAYNQTDNYFNAINFAVQDECYKLHLDLLGSHTTLPLSYPPYGETTLRAIMESVLNMNAEVDGFLIDERVPDELLEPILPHLTKPLIIVNRTSRLPIVTVTQPNRAGMLAILEASRKFGYHSYIFGEMSRGSQNELERRAAFYEYLKLHQIPLERVHTIAQCGLVPPEQTEKRLEEAISKLKPSDGRILFVASSDHIGRPVADYLLRRYGNFRQVGVISFNGFELAFRSPVLATVRTDPVQLGILAVRKLQSLLTAPERCQSLNITTEVNFTLGETL